MMATILDVKMSALATSTVTDSAVGARLEAHVDVALELAHLAAAERRSGAIVAFDCRSRPQRLLPGELRSARVTRPASPSTRSRSSSAIRRIASRTLTTAGSPNSRATTAPCDR